MAPEKGITYSKSFDDLPYRKMIWKWEQATLSEIIDKYFRKNTEVRYLDFACGTGRILGYLEDRVSEAIGVDLSESMINIARNKTKRSKLYIADLTREEIFTPGTFNLITAFRFFLNAQWELKNEVMMQLANLLSSPHGYLVFNVHLNAGSSQEVLKRAYTKISGRPIKYNSLSIADVKRLTSGANLQIVAMYHFGVIPIRKESDRLPYQLMYQFEKFFSHFPFLRRFSRNVIFVCKKNNKDLG
jgi:predicted TPR repeat methyltransferase